MKDITATSANPSVVLAPSPFQLSSKSLASSPGQNLAEVLGGHITTDLSCLRILVNGDIITDPRTVTLRAGDIVVARAIPEGGGGGSKDVMRTVLTIAVVAFAAWTPVGLAAMGGTSWSIGFTAMGSALVTAGVTAVGMMTLNSVFPPASIDTGSNTPNKKIYSINGGANALLPYGPIPQVLGIVRFVPPYFCTPYTELVGDDQYVRLGFQEGYGPLTISDRKLGETLLTNYADYEIDSREGLAADTDLTLITEAVYEDAIGTNLSYLGGAVIHTSGLNADEISLDIEFPGLVYLNDDGNREALTIVFSIHYSPTGLNTWTLVDGAFTVTGASTVLVRKGLSFQLPTRGQYDVKVQRLTSGGDVEVQGYAQTSTWARMRTITHGQPITTRGKTAREALRIKATDQLSGNLDPYNVIASLRVREFDGDVWAAAGSETISNNPAALSRYVLQGGATPDPVADGSIDLTALEDWHQFCVANGFQYNKVLTGNQSRMAVLQELAAAGRGRYFENIDGKHTWIWDNADKVSSALFTPRNSWGFKSTRLFPELPHAFKVRYQNEDEGYRDDEVIVYAPGYSDVNATLFESIEFPGVTSFALIHKHAWYHLACLYLQLETIQISADFENLAVLPGARITYQDDIMAIGMGSARIKEYEVDTGEVLSITFDGFFDVGGTTEYLAVVRDEDMGLSNISMTPYGSVTGLVNRFIPVATLLEVNAPVIGSLAAFGISGTVTTDLLVKDILPSSDLSATLVCKEFVPGIYTYAGGTLPAYTSHVADTYTIGTPANILATMEGVLHLNDAFRPVSPRVAELAITWTYPVTSVKPDGFICQIRQAGLTTQWQEQKIDAGSSRAVFSLVAVGTYDIRVRAVGSASVGPWATGSFTVPGSYGDVNYDGTLPAPTTPTIYFTPQGAEITNIRLTCGATSGAAMPDGIGLFYAQDNTPNTVVIGTYSAPDITISDTTIESSGTLTVAGSSADTKAIVLATTAQPLDTNFNAYGMWWVQVDATGRAAGLSQAQKVISNDATKIYCAEAFTVVPQAGDIVKYVEVAYHDTRIAGDRQIIVVDGANYEIISYGDVTDEGGTVAFRDCTRGAEGTTPLASLDGLTAHHCAGPGGGESKAIIFPASDFQEVTVGVYSCLMPVAITIPEDIEWLQMTCCTYKRVPGADGFDRLVRSNLVPVVYGGAL